MLYKAVIQSKWTLEQLYGPNGEALDPAYKPLLSDYHQTHPGIVSCKTIAQTGEHTPLNPDTLPNVWEIIAEDYAVLDLEAHTDYWVECADIYLGV